MEPELSTYTREYITQVKLSNSRRFYVKLTDGTWLHITKAQAIKQVRYGRADFYIAAHVHEPRVGWCLFLAPLDPNPTEGVASGATP